MKKIIAFLSLLLSANSFAASGSGNISNVVNIGGTTNGLSSSAPSVEVPEGSVSSTNTPYYKTLFAYVNAATLNSYWAFYDITTGSNTQYRVPSGKKFYVTQIIAINANSSSTAIAKGQAGYATSTFSDGATSVTGGIYTAGNAGYAPFLTSSVSTYNVSFYFPALSYPFINANNVDTVSYQLIGKEQ